MAVTGFAINASEELNAQNGKEDDDED